MARKKNTKSEKINVAKINEVFSKEKKTTSVDDLKKNLNLSGKSDVDELAELKRSINFSEIENNDVDDLSDLKRKLKKSNVESKENDIVINDNVDDIIENNEKSVIETNKDLKSDQFKETDLIIENNEKPVQEVGLDLVEIESTKGLIIDMVNLNHKDFNKIIVENKDNIKQEGSEKIEIEIPTKESLEQEIEKLDENIEKLEKIDSDETPINDDIVKEKPKPKKKRKTRKKNVEENGIFEEVVEDEHRHIDTKSVYVEDVRKTIEKKKLKPKSKPKNKPEKKIESVDKSMGDINVKKQEKKSNINKNKKEKGRVIEFQQMMQKEKSKIKPVSTKPKIFIDKFLTNHDKWVSITSGPFEVLVKDVKIYDSNLDYNNMIFFYKNYIVIKGVKYNYYDVLVKNKP